MANNYDLYLNGVVFSGTKADFTRKKLVLPSTLTPVSVLNNVLNIDCDNASNGLFAISSIAASTTINSLKISNPVIGGQYVVYITNTSSQFELSIMGRANLTVTVNNGINIGKLNYPVTILVRGGGANYFSNAILSFTYDGSNVYVACSQYS